MDTPLSPVPASPSTMDCGTVLRPGEFLLQERPLPEHAPDGWALIDVSAAGICGTDYHILEGKHPFLEYPRVIGHELSGRIVHPIAGYQSGDLVVVNPYLSCGGCRACAKGKENCCVAIEVLGVHRDGGLCPRIAVPSGNLYPADGLSDTQAAMVEFLAIGAHAVRRAALEPGEKVLVTGAGPIGLGTAIFARLQGANVHLLDLSQARLAQAQELLGFEHLHLGSAQLLTGDNRDGFDALFDATGNAKAIEAGFPFLAHGSRYILVSVVKDDITFNDPEFHKRETQIIGSRNATKQDFQTVVNAMRAQEIDTDALCSLSLSLGEFESRFCELAQDRETLIKVIVRP